MRAGYLSCRMSPGQIVEIARNRTAMMYVGASNAFMVKMVKILINLTV